MLKHTSQPRGVVRAGIVADGIFKLALGAAYLIACVPLASTLGVATWVIILAGITVALVGASEARLASRRTTRTFLVSLALYDGLWVLVTVAALLLASAGSPFGGELWLGYQIVAAATLTATLLTGVGRVN
ncbi:hypothetical protein [Paramicrobacterium chengjingii]|uniref:Uncharacterized protein n=1 Tax=Paramicrobacterium chengjingii TaxID=2769067 RepID=A0ABX6YJ90_9MICO|nr:hypothetical protein [Microbacterium chengjingii]QPZ38695.1 hypothetical protein HCR76_00880 [Microbacterium chengjingii]